MSVDGSHATGLSRRAIAAIVAGALVVGAVIVAVVLVAVPSRSSGQSPARVFRMGVPSPAPAGWHRTALAGGGGVLAYPAAMQLVAGDRGAVSAVQLSRSGSYLLYLNATPRQGDETLRNWPAFRVSHLLDDDASTAHELASIGGVRFLGGTGTCVSDAYVTKVGAHHFTEIACFVQGRTSASIIIAAAPTADWGSSYGLLRRAIASYLVQ
jgi:hypothetical protein